MQHKDNIQQGLPDDYVSYCVECERYFDTRSGCPTDVAFDEREEILKLVESFGCNCGTLGAVAIKRLPQAFAHSPSCPVTIAGAILARNKD